MCTCHPLRVERGLAQGKSKHELVGLAWSWALKEKDWGLGIRRSRVRYVDGHMGGDIKFEILFPCL